jgi:hypothetical protein
VYSQHTAGAPVCLSSQRLFVQTFYKCQKAMFRAHKIWQLDEAKLGYPSKDAELLSFRCFQLPVNLPTYIVEFSDRTSDIGIECFMLSNIVDVVGALTSARGATVRLQLQRRVQKDGTYTITEIAEVALQHTESPSYLLRPVGSSKYLNSLGSHDPAAYDLDVVWAKR